MMYKLQFEFSCMKQNLTFYSKSIKVISFFIVLAHPYKNFKNMIKMYLNRKSKEIFNLYSLFFTISIQNAI